jgi:hypothetical protein
MVSWMREGRTWTAPPRQRKQRSQWNLEPVNSTGNEGHAS